MRAVIGLLTAGCLVTAHVAPANAVGCISGGLAGAVAGHMAHHGVLGALGGCVAGHMYNKHQKNQDAVQKSDAHDQGAPTHDDMMQSTPTHSD
jgi:uncharacterized membrane protein YebE (DUF533 family)